MLKETVKFVDFNGDEQEETFYFNLTEAEMVRLDLEFEGGLEGAVGRLDPENDPGGVCELFERILTSSYGVKSADGKRFVKSDEQAKEFVDSAAYSALFMGLLTTTSRASNFFEGVMSRTSVEEPAPKKASQLKPRPHQ